MNVHEFQAKKLLQDYGIEISKGVCVDNIKEVDEALNSFEEHQKLVVKSQIHAGGRGKGVFVDGFKGGVKLANNKSEAKDYVAKMLNNTLVTHQTGSTGKKVKKVFITTACKFKKEYYVAFLLDRESGKIVLVASSEGGIDIEEVSENNPEKIKKIFIDPALGLQAFQAREVGFLFGLKNAAFKQCVSLLLKLYKFFEEKDASLIEINPLALTEKDSLEILDLKVSFDDNALFRQKDIAALKDDNESDPKEIEAEKHGLNYIALDGNIACLVNGAGLAMATMDIIKHYGGNPANFLDIGGGANEDQIREAFKIILQDSKVKAILVNIFGGIMRCDLVAKGLIEAAKSVSLKIPLVVRLEGTNVEIAKKLLSESSIRLEVATTLEEAAKKVVSKSQS